MPTQVQFRRGTTAQNNNFTGAAGELSVNTSNNTIRVHDGSTAGGFELANMNRSLRQFASTTSTELRSVLSDETGTGNAVFSLSPTIQSPTVETSIVAGNTTFDLVNTTATTVNFAGAATTLEIGAATGLTNINNNLEVDGDIQIDGGDLTFSTTTANVVNATSTSVNFAGAATTLSIGAGSGTTTVNNNLTVASNSLANNGVVTNAFTAGTLQTAGNVNGNNGNFVTSLSAATLQTTGNLNAAAALIAGNFNATGNVNAVDGRFSTSLTAATLQASGNVNAAASRIAGDLSSTGVLRVSNTTAATGENTGAAIITGGASIGGNLYVGGNLFIAGTTTTLNSNVTILDDPILYLADNSTSDILDLGFVATFNNGTQQHGGFIRDATDGVWKIFSGVTSEPNVNGTVDFTSATYDAVRMGALTASSGTFSSTLSATSSNVNTTGALFTGSATAGTFQTTGNVNSNNELVTGSLTAGTLQTAGNVNGNNLRVATNSSLGTVVQGTWNATPIALNYLAASTISGVSLGNNLNTLTMGVSGTGLSGSTTYNGSGAATFTVTSNATSSNTGSTIVARDASGNFSAGTITATLSGTATQVSNSLSMAVSGTGLSGSASFNGSSAQTFTVTSNATSANTGGTLVARDGSGNFSAGTISATLSGTATQVSNALTIGTGLSGTSYNGSSAVTIANTGVTSVTASTGISLSGSTGGVTITNTGVTSITGTSNQVTASASTGGVTLSLPQNIHTGASPTFTGLTVAKSGTTSLITFPAQSNDPGYISHVENNNAAIMYFNVSDDTNDEFNFGYLGAPSTFRLRSDGVVLAGTWQGSSISTSYTDAKVTAVNAGTGISVNQTTGSLTVTNSGVTSATAGTGISVSGSTGGVTFTNTGVTSLVAGTNIAISSGTGAVTVSVSGTVSAATNATNVAITDDTSTNSTHYPTFVSATSGNAGQKTSSSKLTFNPSSGLLTSTDYNSSSDKRLKTNIKTIDGALDKVNKLRGVTFNWKETKAASMGLIAQEVAKVLPDVVTADEAGTMGVKYNNLIGLLVEAIKEQQDQINDLKKQIEKLNG